MIRVRVPASSANLGPGFDAFAAALALHLELEVTETGSFSFGTDLHVARDRRNLAVRAFARLHPPDRFAFRMRSVIPLSGGLGSSGAACVAGLLAADRVRGGGSDLLGHAIEMEGHPDNVAASLLGGVTAYVDGRAARLEPPAGLSAILVVPRSPVRTAAARAALPATVPLADAAANAGHAALLLAGPGARRPRPRRVRPARPHPPALPRAPVPAVGRAPRARARARRARRDDLGRRPDGARLGAHERQAVVREALEREARGWARVMPAEFEPRGAQVLEG